MDICSRTIPVARGSVMPSSELVTSLNGLMHNFLFIYYARTPSTVPLVMWDVYNNQLVRNRKILQNTSTNSKIVSNELELCHPNREFSTRKNRRKIWLPQRMLLGEKTPTLLRRYLQSFGTERERRSKAKQTQREKKKRKRCKLYKTNRRVCKKGLFSAHTRKHTCYQTWVYRKDSIGATNRNSTSQKSSKCVPLGLHSVCVFVVGLQHNQG